MTNLRIHAPTRTDFDGDLTSLRGDCARMAPRWTVSDRSTARPPVPPSLIHGVSVPASSARLLDAMSEYGD